MSSYSDAKSFIPPRLIPTKRSDSLTTLTSTGSSTASDLPPSLPQIALLRHIELHKRSPISGEHRREWGFIVRGTTTEFPDGNKIYTCTVDSVTEGGLAEIVGLEKGDQILSIDGMQVKDCGHNSIIQLFKDRESLSLVVLPNKYRNLRTARVTISNSNFLGYFWCLSRCLDTLEIQHVKLQQSKSCSLAGLYSLRHLTLTHCMLDTVQCLKSLSAPKRLRSLNLSHNQLTHEHLNTSCALIELTSLQRLDLSHNFLMTVPTALTKLGRLVTLVLTNNMISKLPDHLNMLSSLETLSLDGNELEEIDSVIGAMSNLRCISVTNNLLETEAHCLRFKAFKIIAIQGNPYTDKKTLKKNAPRRQQSVRSKAVYVKGNFLRQSINRMSLCLCLDGPSSPSYDKLPSAKAMTLGHMSPYPIATQ